MKKRKQWLTRYKLWGDLTWCLNPANGWFRFNQTIVRWNTFTSAASSKECFSITNIAKSKLTS